MDNASYTQLLYNFEIHTPTINVISTSLSYFIARVLLKVKWQKRTTTTEILEVIWSMCMKTMFIYDICRDVNDRQVPKYDELSGITISRGSIKKILQRMH